MKLFVLASFIAAAAAFAPSAQQGTFSSALFAVKKAPVKKAPLKKAPVKKASPVKKAPIKRAAPVKRGKAIAFENELGVQPPLGFWDPLGYLKNADAAKFEKLRGLEIKHGRTYSIVSYRSHLILLITKPYNNSFRSLCRCCPIGLFGIYHNCLR